MATQKAAQELYAKLASLGAFQEWRLLPEEKAVVIDAVLAYRATAPNDTVQVSGAEGGGLEWKSLVARIGETLSIPAFTTIVHQFWPDIPLKLLAVSPPAPSVGAPHKIVQGLKEAVAYAGGDKSVGRDAVYPKAKTVIGDWRGLDLELPPLMCSQGGFVYNEAHIEYWKRRALAPSTADRDGVK